MAYEIKYQIKAATKADTEVKIYLYENGYDGDIIEYPSVNMQLQYIPRSDDIFEPVYVSQLNIVLDVTDNVDNMPDFSTLDDRKYFVTLLVDDILQWQGWALSENVQFSFSTGRKELGFIAIDGLGMLERIPFGLLTSNELTGRRTLIDYISTSLSKLQYPLSYNIVSGISFFTQSMNDRIDAAINDPLNQTYINYANFVNDNQETTNCLDVITQIAKGFGARLFQAEGNFYIVAITELAQDSYYSTIYSSLGVPISASTKDLTGNIEGYTGNTSGLYFVDNSQFKLIKKGYNKIRFNKVIDYPNNYITNWDLKNYTFISALESNAFSWVAERYVDGVIYVKPYPEKKNNSWIMNYSLSSPFIALVKPINLPKVNVNDVIELTLDVAGIGVPASGPDALFILKISVDNGVNSVFLNENKIWVDSTVNDHYYYYPFDSENPKVNLEIVTPLLPIEGDLAIELILSGSSSSYWKTTVGSIEATNFNLKLETYFKEVTTESFINDTNEYLLNIDLPLGFNDINDGSFSYRGFLSDIDGLNLKNWYRQEYPTDVYRSLSELVVRQYSNCLNKNIINLDGSFMGIETSDGRFNASMRLTASDTDPVQISVNTKNYTLGNSTIDYPNNVITATLLDINPENIESTMTTIYDTRNLSSIETGFSCLRSNGYITKEAALAAPLTSNVIYLEQVGVPSVGDFFYQNEFLIVGFNGAGIWWKVLVTDTYSQAYRISGSGEILETFG